MSDRGTTDRRTLEAMGLIYCYAHHPEGAKDGIGLCPSCRDAVEAVLRKTSSCPHEHKINCQDCDIKCQRAGDIEQVRAIMGYAAPRMIYRHPIMTIRYIAKKIAARQ